MKVIEHLNNANGKTLFSLEILPPLKGAGIHSLFTHIDPLMEFNPPFIDVTYHREEHVYRNVGNGLLEKKTIWKRPGTVGICAAIQNKYKVDTVPHIICGGFTVEETENALIDLNFLSIDNALVIQGDAIKSEQRFISEPTGHDYAVDLIKQIVKMNNGQYLDQSVQNPNPTNFCLGVAGYPEKHFEAPNMASDLKFLKQKVDNGADYIVTQMFFNNQKYFEFEDACRKIGIEIPIIPGLKPLTTKKQVSRLPSLFHIDIPQELSDEVNASKDNEAAREIGVEWCINQSKELMEKGVPCLHYYSMGKAEPVYRIAKHLF